MRQQCSCARQAYRNNLNGSRDYKIVGLSSCRICRGSGWVKTCEQCSGAGIFKNDRCEKCNGYGKLRVEK
jgi:hypothetical protein